MAITETFSKPRSAEPVEVPVVPYLARFVGVVFLAAAVGLWIAPGANWAAELALLKLGLTCFFAITGALSLTIRRR
ncbi:hypothetical protein [Pseudaestuariivita atlantica]|uniref:Uncharacterized protein n=1 Tax=Pseudaestuariivita atlantica TaxID=1317121 RepID=A0A0L1JU71_9RHOB|nr:hypothetical protein [Pseudaestuariivita atlantica]KNG95305.1 hypothetical protein ATO11_01355 [Pseudaestuariivita atlantica]